MSEHILDANGLHTFYGVSHILHGVDFTVRRARPSASWAATAWARPR
jgi:ABC-type branched-subunit amino acid transport system ATPase component